MVTNNSNKAVAKLFPELFFVLLILPSIIWTFTDNHVWPWDQAWYGEVTTSLWIVLSRHPAQWLSALLSAFGAKPPGIAWFGEFFIPLGIYIHRIDASLLLSVLVLQWLTLLLIYRVNKELCLKSHILPFIGCLLTASMPLFVGMSNQYFVEPMQTFSVAYFYWIALKCTDWSTPRTLGHSTIAGFIGLLAKFSTPIYCFFPTLIILWNLISKILKNNSTEKNSKLVDWFLLACGLILGALTIAWYKINFTAMWNHVMESSVGTTALGYGHKDIFINKLMLWSNALLTNFFIPEIGWCLAVLILLVSIIHTFHRAGKLTSGENYSKKLLVLAAFLQILLVLLIFSTTINEEHRYLMPLIPSIIIVLTYVIYKMNSKLVNYAFLALAILQFSLIQAQAHGLMAKDERISSWLIASEANKNKSKELERIIKLTSNPHTPPRYNICGVELPWLNANSLSFYVVKHELQTHKRDYYTSLGYAESDKNKALKRLEDIRTLYFISIDESKNKIPTDMFNQVSSSVLEDLLQNKQWDKVPFKSDLNIIILRNNKNY